MFGWNSITREDYKKAYNCYGGSVINHPDVLDFIHERKECKQKYLGLHSSDGQLISAICLWGRYLSGDVKANELYNIRDDYDFGYPEIILPIKNGTRVIVPAKAVHLSELNKEQVVNSTFSHNKNRTLCFAKDLGINGFSSKSKNTRRKELKKFTSAGGCVYDVSDFSSDTLRDIYTTLYKIRWKEEHPHYSQLNDMMGRLKNMIFGHVLMIHDTPAAFHFVLKASCREWNSYEYINGGVNTELSEFSPGTIVTWLNVERSNLESESEGKIARYSFGRNSAEYKKRWANDSKVGKVLFL